MSLFPCPYLGADVEWTEERERHTTERHPDFLHEHRDKVAATLAEPDDVRRSRRFGNARLLSRWFADLHEGKHVVVVVVSDPAPSERHWVVTAYIARRLAQGDSEWTRPS
jgi:hypothetical protein